MFNLIVAQLPDSITQFDMTDSGIYNITDGTAEFLAGLTEDVEIHVLCPEEQVDSRIVRFLNLYRGLSDRLTVEYTDPVAHPSVLSKYGVEPVSPREPVNTVATGGLWALLFIFVIPLAAIVYSFVRWSRRREL